jgi:hypothetical protein
VLGPTRPAPRYLWATATVLLLVMSVPATTASGLSSGIALTVGNDGGVTAGLNFIVQNGSALRYAMDGYFGPLIALLPGNSSSKAAILAEINVTENNPLFAGYFGDHDGKVNGVDVYRFQSLVDNESKLIPLSSITGVLNVTLDGNSPTTDLLRTVTFSDAVGLDNSTAPMGLTTDLALSFVWSGTGKPHTFDVSWNLPAILGNLTVPILPVNVSFRTPPAVTITSVTGLSDTHISNDPFGWGSASASGEYTPLPGHSIVVQFGPSFPTGDALIVIAVVIVAGAVVGVLLFRRRRGRRKSPAGPSGPVVSEGPEVGPSSGSG